MVRRSPRALRSVASSVQKKTDEKLQCLSPIPVQCQKRFQTLTVRVRCRQCLPCRIARKDDLTLRCLLEGQTETTSSFWTLTFEDMTLPSDIDEWKTRLRTFFNSLRASEKRGGNPNMIRFFGCSEYGGSFGRPHSHFIIWNLLRNYYAVDYFKGLPRPPLNTALWPHGHVDLGTVTPASINYVAGYLTDFVNPEYSPLAHSTRRPAIGFSGICALGAMTARKLRHIHYPPSTVEIRGRHFSVSTYTKGVFLYAFRQAGGKLILPEDYIGAYRQRLEQYRLQDEATPQFLKKRATDRIRRFAEKTLQIETQKQTREQIASSIYAARLPDHSEEDAA